MRVRFAKMVAAGNDFVVLDGRSEDSLSRRGGDLARLLCPRRFSVGADGLMVLERSTREGCLFAMGYFNADGSRGEMCGNGARSLAEFARSLGLFEREARFATDAGDCLAVIEEPGRVRLSMPPGRLLAEEVRAIAPSGRQWAGAWIDSGVPHFVPWLDAPEELEALDIAAEGRALRLHEAFAPRGANVDFAVVLPGEGGAGRCRIRTYERGVEAETLGCGSGAVASAAAWLLRGGLSEGRMAVETRSGEALEVSLALRGGRLEDVLLTGSAAKTFEGWADADL